MGKQRTEHRAASPESPGSRRRRTAPVQCSVAMQNAKPEGTARRGRERALSHAVARRNARSPHPGSTLSQTWPSKRGAGDRSLPGSRPGRAEFARDRCASRRAGAGHARTARYSSGRDPRRTSGAEPSATASPAPRCIPDRGRDMVLPAPQPGQWLPAGATRRPPSDNPRNWRERNSRPRTARATATPHRSSRDRVR